MKTVELTCHKCGEKFERSLDSIKKKQRKGGGKRAFCSRRCAGQKSPQPSLELECDYCHKKFNRHHSANSQQNSRNVFCSNTCKGLFKAGKPSGQKRAKRVSFDCEWCEKTVEMYESAYKRKKNNFCSLECEQESKKIEDICRECQNTFRKNKNSKEKFCSSLCSEKNENKKFITFYCDQCYVPFKKKKKDELIPNKKMGHFCSQSCYKKHCEINKPYKKYIQKALQGHKRIMLRTSKNERVKMNLTPTYLKSLYERQNGRCSYTGLIIPHPNGGFKLDNASLDRIDSSKGYIKGNVEFVCAGVNFAKNNLSKKETMEFFGRIRNGK